MALNLNTNPNFSGRITAPDANYPYGSSKDESSPGANDGTPYLKQRSDDIFGLQQAILSEAGITPNESADTALASQYLNGLKSLLAGGKRNYIIDGGFSRWDEATSQTTSGYGSDTMWFNANSGSTKTASRQTFTLGQTDVPGNPEYFSRTVVSSVAGAANFCSKAHRIENVETLSGETVALSFYAKADATKNIAIDFVQYFGTGGSPSSDVSSIGAQKIELSSSWSRYAVSIDIPSVSGKSVGTDNNDFLELSIWFDAGSDLNSRTDSLGQQSGTFDIYGVQIEIADNVEQVTEFEVLPKSETDNLVNRYFELVPAGYQGPSTSAANNGAVGRFTVEKRAIPLLLWQTNISSLNFPASAVGSFYLTATTKSIYPVRSATATATDSRYEDLYSVDARL